MIRCISTTNPSEIVVLYPKLSFTPIQPIEIREIPWFNLMGNPRHLVRNKGPFVARAGADMSQVTCLWHATHRDYVRRCNPGGPLKLFGMGSYNVFVNW